MNERHLHRFIQFANGKPIQQSMTFAQCVGAVVAAVVLLHCIAAWLTA